MRLRAALVVLALGAPSIGYAEDKTVPCADVKAMTEALRPVIASMGDLLAWCKAEQYTDPGCVQFATILAQRQTGDHASLVSMYMASMAMTCGSE